MEKRETRAGRLGACEAGGHAILPLLCANGQGGKANVAARGQGRCRGKRVVQGQRVLLEVVNHMIIAREECLYQNGRLTAYTSWREREKGLGKKP